MFCFVVVGRGMKEDLPTLPIVVGSKQEEAMQNETARDRETDRCTDSVITDYFSVPLEA